MSKTRLALKPRRRKKRPKIMLCWDRADAMRINVGLYNAMGPELRSTVFVLGGRRLIETENSDSGILMYVFRCRIIQVGYQLHKQ